MFAIQKSFAYVVSLRLSLYHLWGSTVIPFHGCSRMSKSVSYSLPRSLLETTKSYWFQSFKIHGIVFPQLSFVLLIIAPYYWFKLTNKPNGECQMCQCV